jgi:error-prone DNA polymerase
VHRERDYIFSTRWPKSSCFGTIGLLIRIESHGRQKKEEVSYPHPSLEPVLKRTLGAVVQEQLLRMAMTVDNFTSAEAEELRSAVGVRRSWERMKSLQGKLRIGGCWREQFSVR